MQTAFCGKLLFVKILFIYKFSVKINVLILIM